MPDHEKKLNLTDLIDINLLQNLQDTFAKAMNVASLTVDDNGPITKPSNFTDFCMKHTRGSKLGLKRCNDCDIKWGKLAASKGEPVTYPCHTGLTDFAVPIIVDGQHIASILGGQILTEEPNEEHFREVARELGINEDAYIDSLKKIKVISAESVKEAANLLHLVANAISEIGRKNLELMAKNKDEAIYREIIETVRSTLDIKKTKNIIVEIVCNTFNADRCFIAEYDNVAQRYLEIQDEYLSSDAVTSYKGADTNVDVPKFAEALKAGKPLIINNKEVILDTDNKDFEVEHKAINHNGVNSAIAVPLNYSNQYLGVLTVHYVNEKHEITDDEVNLLINIGDQVAIAIHQSKLYNALKQNTANQNAILNNIPFMAWLKDAQGRLLAVNDIYAAKCNLPAKEVVGKTDFDFFPKEHAENYIREDRMVMDTKQSIPSTDLIVGPNGNRWHETIKSPVFNDKGDVIGTVGLSRDITEAKEAELELLHRQEQIVKAAEREKLIGKIIAKAISTFDISQFKQIVNDVGVLTSADRCYFVEVDLEQMKGRPIGYDAEYLKSPDIKSVVGYEFSREDVEKFVELFISANDLVVFDYEDIRQGNVAYFEGIIRYSTQFELKSGIGIPFIYREKLKAVLAIEYVNNKVFPSNDELDFLRILANQTGMAYNQIQDYNEAKKRAEREALIRKITENMRRSLDVEQTLSFICEETAKLFNVQRAAITSFSGPVSDRIFTIRKEYRVLTDTPEYGIGEDFSKTAHYWNKILSEGGGVVAFNDIEKSDAPDYFKRAYDSMGIKSVIGTAIKKGDDIFGTLVLSEYNLSRFWSEEEKTLLDTIADQIYISINQAELFDKEKKTAEREILLRKIVETIRSSLDIQIVKKKVINETCKAFGADRCYFRSYDKINDKFFAPDVEYLASSDVKSLMNVEPNQEGLRYFAEEVKRLNRGFYPIVVDEEFSKDTPLEPYVKESDIKADCAVPIINKEDELTWLVLHYTKKDPHLDEDYKKLLETIAYQIDIAFTQIKFYNTAKVQAEKEMLLRTIIETIRNTLDINETKKTIVNEIGKALNADRVMIVEFDVDTHIPVILDENSEYLSSSDELSYVGYDFAGAEFATFSAMHNENKTIIIKDVEKFIEDNNLRGSSEEIWLRNANIKTAISIPLFYANKVYGVLAIHYTKSSFYITDEQMEFVNTLGVQTSIALYQSRLFAAERKKAERESLLRKILEEMLSSLDINSIKQTIVNEIGKTLNVDACFILSYEPTTDEFYIDEHSEYLSSSEEKSFVGYDAKSLRVKYFIDSFRKNQEISFVNVDDFIIENNLQGTPEEAHMREYNIKSSYKLPIIYAGNLLGCIILQYTKNQTRLSESEIDFLRLIATRAGIAIHQAKLYKLTQIQAEREKISRNIIEILRSTLDKATIIHLFVRNIGKYFEADRVFYAEYNSTENIFIPVTQNAEYLSSPDVKSFVGYDWSDESASEYIQPLLNKRELNIFSWDEYIRQNPKNEAFINLFESANVKSSYNLPVLYQQKIMGYFCIEFTKNENKLADEDINRIRNMCTQAGIALYHSDLYAKANELANTNIDCISMIADELKAPLDDVIKISELLSAHDIEQDKKIEYIGNLNLDAKRLLDVESDIQLMAKIKDEDFKLTLSYNLSSPLINEVLDSISYIINTKGIVLTAELANVSVFIDKEMLTKALYNILNSASLLVPNSTEIAITSKLENSELFIIIDIRGAVLTPNLQSEFFEKFKHIDSANPVNKLDAGISLSIVKRLITLHKGGIHVEAIEDNGIRITLTLHNAN